MARKRRRHPVRRLLIIAGVVLVIWLIAHAKPYLDDQKTLQHYVDTHASAPATPGH